MRFLKYISITIGLLFLYSPSYSQIITDLDTTKFDPFKGTWVYATENEQFIIKTKLVPMYIKGKLYKYALLATFKYTKGINIIYDNTDKFNSLENLNHTPLCFFSLESKITYQQPRLYISYYDFKNGNTTEEWKSPLIIISTNPLKLSWHIEEDKWETNYDPDNNTGFSIPTDMILTKIE